MKLTEEEIGAIESAVENLCDARPGNRRRFLAMCGFDGGLWPLSWAVLIICVTVWNIVKLKHRKSEGSAQPQAPEARSAGPDS